MGYIKAIIYGSNLDLYTYEKNIGGIDYKRAGIQSSIRGSNMVKGSESDGDEELQKRRDNLRRSEMAFRRLVLSNIRESEVPTLITTTYSENQKDVRVGYEDFRSFIGNVRYKFGKAFRYISVIEFQKRGAIHFHTLFWGLPKDLYSKERDTRVVARCWGRGFTDVYLTDNSEKLSSYLSKYMIKSADDPRLFGKKAYRCSRNVIRPVFELNLAGTWYLSEKYGIGVDNPPRLDKTFSTYWLGKGRYRAYKLNPQNYNGNSN